MERVRVLGHVLLVICASLVVVVVVFVRFLLVKKGNQLGVL